MFKINETRLKNHLDALAEFGRDERGGWTRFSFTPEYLEARNLVQKWMEEAGMAVRVDAAGNLIGRLEGLDSSLPVVAAGSHIDTVKNGGKFDGNFGVLGAIEVVQTIKENGLPHKHPIEVIVFVEEEGGRFGAGLFGSRAMNGQVDKEFLFSRKDKDGVTIADAFKATGLDPDKIAEARINPGYYKAYFEMHIEQGAVLDSLGISIGVVEGIAAPVWLKALLNGRADHAGATPMNLRRDALVAASELVVVAERIAKEVGGSAVATVGKLTVLPGGANVVPGQVEMIFDIRDIYDEQREKVIVGVKTTFQEVCKKRSIDYEMEEMIKIDPVILPPHMTGLIEEAAKEVVGAFYHRMVSGAGHDAQIMAKITDVAMIFVPSKDGLSHCPDEWTEMADMAAATQVLLQALLKIT